ncbi:MAG TPA: peptidylprolyl isomerase [Chitinispirillaceae bacterium]|nr:peptidylprolyl isomerase [Chitinispirillaceae bacterium]
MINKMRDFAPTIMLIILVAFVATIFLDWGMNVTGKSPKSRSAGKIDGKEVPLSYFDQQVISERQRVQDGKRNASPMELKRVPQDVWEREVNRVLMNKIVSQMKLGASADQVFEYIKRNPLPGIDTASQFMTNGVFDTSKYVAFLSDPDMYASNPWLNYISDRAEKDVIPAQNLEMLLNANAVPAKSEIEHQYRLEHEKMVFEYASVNASRIHADKSKIDENALKSLYEQKKDSFKTSEKAQVYFFKFPKVATAYDEQVYYQEMKDFKDQILSAENKVEEFTRLAQTLSDDPSAENNGGDLGWFGRGSMVPEFEQAAFSMDSGSISDPVKTQYGYHLIMVEGKIVKADKDNNENKGKKGIKDNKENKDIKEQVKARHILRKITPTIETIDIVSAKADSVREMILNKGLAETVKNCKDVQFDSTVFFGKGEIIPGVGYISGAGQFIFGEDKDKAVVSERMENDDAIYLLVVKGKSKKGTMPFEMAKDTLKAILTDSLNRVAAREYMEKTLKSLGSDASIAKLKDTDSNLVSGTTDTVSGAQYIPGVGYNSKVAAAASALPVGKISSLVEHDNNYYLVKTLWKNAVDSIPWDSHDITMIKDRIKGQMSQRAYYDWYTTYKNNAKITSNVNDIYLD